AVEAARNEVKSAEEQVQQARANLGLRRDLENPTEVPKDLDQTFPAVQVALSNTMPALAQMGLPLRLYGMTPATLCQQGLNMNPEKDFNMTLDELVKRAPATRLGRAKVDQAEKDLELAGLLLSYTEIRAPIAGTIAKRAVNPSDNVQPRQNLLAVRSPDVWVDANFITDNHSWRWIFLINLPAGRLSLRLNYFLLGEPPYLKAEREARRGQALRIDFLGLGLLALGLGCLEVVLDRGQQDDWFGSPFIVRLAVLAAVGLTGTVVWELYTPNPIINLRLLKDRNFLLAS